MLPKILLVDDRPDNLLSIETILESHLDAGNSYQFVKATSEMAIKVLLRETDFALILMDVKFTESESV